MFAFSSERYLLVDPENSSTVTKQWVALLVGHELAHQWFGNLVSSYMGGGVSLSHMTVM